MIRAIFCYQELNIFYLRTKILANLFTLKLKILTKIDFF